MRLTFETEFPVSLRYWTEFDNESKDQYPLSTFTSNLFSGIIGAILGSLTTIIVAIFHARSSRFARLRMLLIHIGHELYFKDDPNAILQAGYIDLMDAFLSARALTIQRNKFDVIFYRLIGHTNQQPRHVHCFPSRTDAIKATEELLTFMGFHHESKTVA
jgi:hypothetical protein